MNGSDPAGGAPAPSRLALWRAALARLERGERVHLEAVVAHTRHSPGTTGAKLLVFEDGSTLGTIGGGVMEAAAIARARATLAGAAGPPRRDLVHRRDDPDASGLICAGRQTDVALVLADPRVVARIVACLEDDLPGTLRYTEGGLSLDPVPDALAEEDLLGRARVVVYGGGHCGQALCRQMAWLDWHVTAVDPRDLDHPHADRVLRDVGAPVPHADRAWAVVMTSALASDIRALRAALSQPFRWIGVMGAPAKLAAIRAEVDDARIAAPVGLPIGSATPAEIAVSVAAQLLQLRNAR
jgi:xanthine dehydrogenase accessory factor